MKYVGNAYGYFSLPKEIQANHTKVMGSESKRLFQKVSQGYTEAQL